MPAVDRQLLTDVLTTALEGGIGYWAAASNIERDDDLNVLSVTLHDAEEGDGFGPRTVTLGDIEVALRRIADGQGDAAECIRNDVREMVGVQDSGIADAGIADAIVQFACFGTLVYA